MWNEGSKFAVKEVHEASHGNGVENFLDVIGELHQVVNQADKDVRILIVHGDNDNPDNVWTITNNLSNEEEYDMMMLTQNAVHKEHYAKRDTDPEAGVTAEDMVDDQQTIPL